MLGRQPEAEPARVEPSGRQQQSRSGERVKWPEVGPPRGAVLDVWPARRRVDA